MAKGVVKTSSGETFKVGPSVTKAPSGGDCYYLAGDIKDIPLVIGESLGLPADMLKEVGKGK
jgi:hypothetical protein